MVVLNSVSASVIEGQRGVHPAWVFPHRGKRITKIHNSAWKHSRDKAVAKFKDSCEAECPDGFANIREHDLKHPFGRRLRATGASLAGMA